MTYIGIAGLLVRLPAWPGRQPPVAVGIDRTPERPRCHDRE
jgi:hypothetical protein